MLGVIAAVVATLQLRQLAGELNEVANDRMVKVEKFSEVKDNLNAIARYARNIVIDGKKVKFEMLAEDDEVSRVAIEALCADYGLAVDRAEGSEAALALLTQHDYLLVFLDRELAGVGALEICRFVKARHERVRPTLILTNARAGAIERVRVNLAGVDVQMARPIEVERLQSVFAALGGGPAQDAPSAAA